MNITLDQIREVTGRLSALAREAESAHAMTRTWQDTTGNLTAQGVEDHKKSLAAQVAAKYEPQLNQLTEQLAAMVSLVNDDARQARPTVSPEAMRTAWEDVQTRLDGGMPIQMILNRASVAEALAIRERGPAWIDAAMHANHAKAGGSALTFQGADVPRLHAAVDARLAEVLKSGRDGHTPDLAAQPGQAAKLLAGREATAILAGIGPVVQQVRQTIAGNPTAPALNAAIAGHYAAQAARAQAAPEEPSAA